MDNTINNTMNNCVYNTQGLLVNKSIKQLYSDSFRNYLASCEGKIARETEVPKYVPYVNKCTPPCCSPIGLQTISEKIVDVQYHNDNACTNERRKQKFRIG